MPTGEHCPEIKFFMSYILKGFYRFILSSVVVIALVASSIFAQSQQSQSRSLYMPLLQADSELTLVNPAVEPATVILTARSYAGTVLQGAGINNPVTISLPPSNSKALKAKDIFGAGISSGWVELQTTSSSVSGAFASSLSQVCNRQPLRTSPTRRNHLDVDLWHRPFHRWSRLRSIARRAAHR